jgi:hypothetical protein
MESSAFVRRRTTVPFFVDFVKFNWIMVNMFYALLALTAGFLLVFGLTLYAIARVGRMLTASENLDWEQIATITGDIGALKKSIQRLNNRINGMEAHDPSALIQAISAAQAPNVTQMPVQQQNGNRQGG